MDGIRQETKVVSFYQNIWFWIAIVLLLVVLGIGIRYKVINNVKNTTAVAVTDLSEAAKDSGTTIKTGAMLNNESTGFAGKTNLPKSDWNVITKFEGSKKQYTDVFPVKSGVWRIRWKINPPLTGMKPFFGISVYTNHGVLIDKIIHNDELTAEGVLNENTTKDNLYWLDIDADLNYTISIESLNI